MANLAQLLQTDVMADLDLRGLAQLLREKGRGRDTVLAHITPAEARLLKARGGRGSINPDTGLPEFEDEAFVSDTGGDYGGGDDVVPVDEGTLPPVDFGQDFAPTPGFEVTPSPVPAGGPTETQYAAPAFQQQAVQGGPGFQIPAQATVAPPGEEDRNNIPPPPPPRPPSPEEQREQANSFTGRLQSALSDPGNLARMGLAAGGGLLGLQARNAAQKQAQRAAQQTAALGAPYQQQGQELMAQARSGTLSPASAQAYQAAQAQLAQQTARTGGVGAAQASNQLERMRASLLDNQYQMGLQIANIGDQYARAAIQQGLQGNQRAAQLSQQYYSALGGVLAGTPVLRSGTTTTSNQ